MKIAILFSLLLLAHVTESRSSEMQSRPHLGVCRDSPGRVSSQDENRRCLSAAGRFASYHNRILTIRMKNGSSKVFKTKVFDADAAFGYQLIDFYPELDVFIVGNVSVDSTKFIAVDRQTGREEFFKWASPFYSQDGHFVLVVTFEDSSGDPPTFELRVARGKTVWKGAAGEGGLPANARFEGWYGGRARFATAATSVFWLTPAADGSWFVEKAR